MPIPSPSHDKKGHKTETKSEFLQKCMGDDNMQEYDQSQRAAICYRQWGEKKAKASMVISAGNEEYVMTPEGPEKKVLQVQGLDVHNTDPINDDDPSNPHSAPPAIPFPATVSPKDSQPKDSDNDGGGTEDEDNPEYVGGKFGDKQPRDRDILKREKNSSNPPQDQILNPDGGGLDPNPDNSTTIPKAGLPKGQESWLMGEKQDVDSFDDDSAKPNLDDLSWYVGKKLQFKIDSQTGLAKWPLDFATIEKDFHRPGKNGKPIKDPQKGGNQDSEKDYKDNRPYQNILPDTK